MTRILSVRPAPEEMAQCDAWARELGVTRTDFVRSRLFDSAAKPSSRKEKRFSSTDLVGSLADEFSAVRELTLKYRGQPVGLADGCVVRMAEIYRVCRVFAVDRSDLTVYRRWGTKTIPCVFPERLAPNCFSLSAFSSHENPL